MKTGLPAGMRTLILRLNFYLLFFTPLGFTQSPDSIASENLYYTRETDERLQNYNSSREFSEKQNSLIHIENDQTSTLPTETFDQHSSLLWGDGLSL